MIGPLLATATEALPFSMVVVSIAVVEVLVTRPLLLTVIIGIAVDEPTVPADTPEVAKLLLASAVLKVTVPSTVNDDAISTAPSMSTTSKFVVPSTSRSPLKSALPANVRLDAMSTAPSISTTSRFVVPSTSKSPLASMLPAMTKLDAMSTAPSMSTTSRFVVPSTSKSPLKSTLLLAEIVDPTTAPTN